MLMAVGGQGGREHYWQGHGLKRTPCTRDQGAGCFHGPLWAWCGRLLTCAQGLGPDMLPGKAHDFHPAPQLLLLARAHGGPVGAHRLASISSGLPCSPPSTKSDPEAGPPTDCQGMRPSCQHPVKFSMYCPIPHSCRCSWDKTCAAPPGPCFTDPPVRSCFAATWAFLEWIRLTGWGVPASCEAVLLMSLKSRMSVAPLQFYTPFPGAVVCCLRE